MVTTATRNRLGGLGRCTVPVALLLLACSAAAQSGGASNGGKPGSDGNAAPVQAKRVGVVDSETWQSAKGLIPDEFLARYRRGEWAHEIYEIPPGTVLADLDFVQAGKKNAGRYEVGPQGHVIEVSTRKQPLFIYGPPFPEIDPSDPDAGAKCVWNFFYQSYLLGNSRNYVNLDFVGARGVERRIVNDVYQHFFDGQPPRYQPQSNPQNFLFQQIAGVVAPADLQGTVALSYRFRDPDKRDQQWTYVPALRRVRAVSPANRSDGFLGSDMSQDDGSYFDGKPEDFEWKFVGDGEVLVLYDRTSLLEGVHNLQRLPGGGTEGHDDTRARFAYQQPDWSGESLAWAPLRSQFVLIKRPVWIVEGRPKDPYYLYGKILLRFDKHSWRGSYNSKYDWSGEILNSYLPSYGPYFQIGEEWRAYAWALFTMAQNWRANRATVSYPYPTTPTYQSRISYPDNFFTVDKLTRRGK